MTKEEAQHADAVPVSGDAETGVAETQQSSSKLVRIYAHPWSQIILISLICFCCPGVRHIIKSRKPG